MAQEKELQAFAELQEKINMNVGFSQMVQQQLKRAKVQQRRSELTLEELEKLAADVPMYKQVGKAYFLAPMPQLRDELQRDISAGGDEVKHLTQQAEHAERAIGAAEGELRELMKANPEAARQLMSMMG